MEAFLLNRKFSRIVWTSYADAAKDRSFYLEEQDIQAFLELASKMLHSKIEGNQPTGRIILGIAEIEISELCDPETNWVGCSYIKIGVFCTADVTFERLKPIIACLKVASSFLVATRTPGSRLEIGLLVVPISLMSVVGHGGIGQRDKLESFLRNSFVIHVRPDKIDISQGERHIFQIRHGEINKIEGFEEEARMSLSGCAKFNRALKEQTFKINTEMRQWRRILGKSHWSRKGAFHCGVGIKLSRAWPLSYLTIHRVLLSYISHMVAEIVSVEKGAILVFGVDRALCKENALQGRLIPVDIDVGGTFLRLLSVLLVEEIRCQGSDDEFQQEREEEFFI